MTNMTTLMLKAVAEHRLAVIGNIFAQLTGDFARAMFAPSMPSGTGRSPDEDAL